MRSEFFVFIGFLGFLEFIGLKTKKISVYPCGSAINFMLWFGLVENRARINNYEF